MKLFEIFIVSFSFICITFAETDILQLNQTLKPGQTLVSSSEYFELGFFTPTSNKTYLGIWYKFSTDTVVWVANRNSPVAGNPPVLSLTEEGSLLVRDADNRTVWSSGATSSNGSGNPVAQIMDTGDFVVREGDVYLWESFDHMTDTMLQGAKFGRNPVTGEDNYLTSWKSRDDPSVGDTMNRLDTNGYPQIFMSVKNETVFRSGPWNGLSFGGVNNMKPNPVFSYHITFSDDAIYYQYELIDKSTFSRFVIGNPAVVDRFNWNATRAQWSLYTHLDIDECDVFGKCGANGACYFNGSVYCSCLNGYVPRNLEEWRNGNWSRGCVKLEAGTCAGTFHKIDGVKLPDTRSSWYNKTMSLEECKGTCLTNCSCSGYATLDIAMGTGCLIWFEELHDIKQYNGNGQTFFLRGSGGEARPRNKKYVGLYVTIALAIVVILLGVLIVNIFYRRRRYRGILRDSGTPNLDGNDDLELPLYEFSAISRATDDFAGYNKLGEGGFGSVYKGVLNGEEIAVKRLSRNSGQGMTEFKNEVILIAKLQHRNLVKLFGCCIYGEERLLIYEYMPNKSLDHFIFNEAKRKELGLEKLITIIADIAKGLLYLHHDSRLRIIHRDLKASNVLLDADLNPKISDFGMARMFNENEYMANTKHVVGTYGYMSPEYAVDGVFSTKSDVFSFGVLALEIITGKRNRAFTHPDHNHNLIGHAWKLWMEKRPLELVEWLADTWMEGEVLRWVQVGLLCVQQGVEERPSMSTVVLMLCSDTVLPQPGKPGFFTERSMPEWEYSSSNKDSVSANHATITDVQPR